LCKRGDDKPATLNRVVARIRTTGMATVEGIRVVKMMQRALGWEDKTILEACVIWNRVNGVELVYPVA
jgi:hypothetical protein